MSAGVLAQLVAGSAEDAFRLVTAQHELVVVHRHLEHVTFADAEGVPQVGGKHDAPEGVDATSALLRAHANRARCGDMRSVL